MDDPHRKNKRFEFKIEPQKCRLAGDDVFSFPAVSMSFFGTETNMYFISTSSLKKFEQQKFLHQGPVEILAECLKGSLQGTI